MIRRFLLATLAASAILTPAYAQKKAKNVLDIKTSITDDAIIFPESFEQDTQKMLESWYMKNYTATDDSYRTRSDVSVSDAELTARLAALPTVIDMPYNQIVRKYIERYTAHGRAQVASILGLSIYYNPIFEQELEAQGLPLELKYIPVIESALNPNAVSKSGATGLWQIMLVTAKGLGLEVNSLVDQRRDPYLSSKKAVSYFKDLYETYGDWSLAIAAYNCGPGNVNKAIRRAGGDPKTQTFWSIYNYLPAETRGYVPLFIAANYVMNYYDKHNISPVLPTKPLVTDSVHVKTRLHFNQIAAVLNIPVEEIRLLNPQYRADIIPGSVNNQYSLTLPSQQVQAYLVSEEQICNYEKDRYSRQTTVEPGELAQSDAAVLAQEEVAAEIAQNVNDAGEPTNFDDMPAITEQVIETTPVPSANRNTTVRKLSPGEKVTHKVQEGESLASIANMYGVTPEDIKVSNNLRRNSVRIGQQLTVERPRAGASSSNATAQAQTSNSNTSASAPTSTSATTSTAPAKKTTQAASATSSNSTNRQGGSKKNNTQQSTHKKQQAKPTTTDHQIREGETLSSIARRHGVTVDELRQANNIKGDNIRAGKTLKIPAKKSSAKKGSSSYKKGTSSKRKKRR